MAIHANAKRPLTCSLLESRESYYGIRVCYNIRFFSSNLQLIAVANVAPR